MKAETSWRAAAYHGFRATPKSELPQAQLAPVFIHPCSTAMAPRKANSKGAGNGLTSLDPGGLTKSFLFATNIGNGSAFQWEMRSTLNCPRSN